MRKFLRICLLLWVSSIFTAYSQQQKPNVIVIVVDDAGYADFGCYGGKEIPTPNINQIAKNGTLFTDAYVTASVCAPSRAAMLTGLYQQRFGFEHNTSSKPSPGYKLSDVGIAKNVPTIGNQMKANGYRTIAIGKWHQGDTEPYFPMNRGFDEFYGFIGGHRNFFAYDKVPSREAMLFNNREIVPESQVTYLTDMFTDKASDFIVKNKSNPFFMYLAYNAVHTPMNAKKSSMQQFAHLPEGRRAYAAMMVALDEGIGKVIQTLKDQQLYDNTLIFLINDNGAATNNSADNGKLRGLKGSKWEGGIRVAFLMQWPGKVPAGNVYHNMVSSLDILPTAVAAANGKFVEKFVPDGKNLVPFIDRNNRKKPHEALFWRRGVAAAVRKDKWKIIKAGDNPLLLFDLSKDTSETTNLALKNLKKVKELLRDLQKWEQKMDKPHWFSDYGDNNQLMKHRMEVVGREMERKYP
ncbi:MAG: sulfatase [Pedobacter sp.]